MNKKTFNNSDSKTTASKGVKPKGKSNSDVSDNNQGKNSDAWKCINALYFLYFSISQNSCYKNTNYFYPFVPGMSLKYALKRRRTLKNYTL